MTTVNNKAKILVVDDQLINLKILQEVLKNDYMVILARNGQEALEKVLDFPDLILLDIMMPNMDGYEVCERLKNNEYTNKIPVIFVTSLGEEKNEKKGLDLGAVDYITKPIKPVIVKARLRTHLALRNAEKQLAEHNIILEAKVKQRTKELSDSRLEIVHRLVSAAEYKDPETGFHIKRMSHYSEVIANAYGLSEHDCEIILLASPMHDIGKIGIPDNILLKPGKLTKDEWKIMKRHTNIGSEILSKSKSELIRFGQQIAITHHEKWDGSGYPYGLKGKAIPVYGRITALADVFDALTSKRPYKEPWSIDRALEEIINGRGLHFEPELVDIFEKIFPQILEIKELFP
ncbi:putative two-component system response regulator [Candidatus Magnetomoraceae bacterium gMMP-15]